MSYTPAVGATAANRVRFMLGDTDGTTEVFSDTELAMVLDVTGETEAGIYAAAAECALAITASASRQAIALTILGQELVLDKRGVASSMRALWKILMDKAAQEDPGITTVWRDGNIDHLRASLTTMNTFDHETNTIEGA